MFIRQVKRKCNVRGCKNTDCFAISRTREFGNTVIICKTCLGKGLGAVDEIDPMTKSNIPAIDNTSAPALFFNAKALGAAAVETTDADDPTPEAEDITEETDTPEEVTSFKCPDCGKEFDSEKGLKTHLRNCRKQSDEGAEVE